MSNKRYLIGFLVYGLLFFGVMILEGAYTYTTPLLADIRTFVLGLVVLIPVTLAWLVSSNLRSKNYKFVAFWLLLLPVLSLLYFIIFENGNFYLLLPFKVRLLIGDIGAFLLYGFALMIPLYPVGITAHRLLKKDYYSARRWGIASVVIGGLFVVIIWSSMTTYDPGRNRDGRRASDIRQIELALELYYAAHKQYPTSTPYQKLIDEAYLNMASPPVDPATGNNYCYAYGRAATGTHPVQYYHVGARLEKEESDLLCDDADYSSTSTIWKAVYTKNCPSTPYGFIGKGTGYCGELEGHPIYDHGVFPE